MTTAFSADERFALQLDADDPLRDLREKFHLPRGKDGKPVIYFAGNSLGLMPKSARQIVEEELDNWATLGVDAHHATGTPWYSYHEALREPTARLVGAMPLEVICMNSLTVNLHLMMATFYRPTKSRFKILMEEPAFPSDTYAIKTQIVHRGLDQKDALILARPRKSEFTIRTEDILDLIDKNADQLAIVIFGGANFFTGQLFDIKKITAAAHTHGIIAGFDLAHAVGNVPLSLHDWNVDFAVWCSYKYLNAGPGAVAGAFVHERHATNTSLPRLAGWFGNDPHSRFRLHLEPDFIPVPSADGWQISNPPIFSMAPLRASLAIFSEVGGMESLRAKSMKLTGYLAQKEGGKIALGGSAPKSPNERCRDGYFFQPTVITGLPVSCRTNREEIFGPVVTITPFDNEEEVINYANDCDYGLASSVWTQNLSRAHRVAERINTGTVWVNCWLLRDLRVPFGGMKQSGVGREGGEEALRFFTEPKNVCIAK